MKSKIYSVLLFVIGLFLQPLSAQKQLNTEKLVAFENYLLEEINEGKMAGVEVLIHHKGENVWHKTLGMNDLSTQAPLTPNSIYFIQSMTKPIMSVAIMQLVEKGLIGLDDHVEKYLPEIGKLGVIKDINSGISGETVPQKTPITIRHLLSHTAGLSHGLEENIFDQQLFKLMYNDPFDPIFYDSVEEEVKVLFQVPLIGHAGEQWYYSAGPDILAVILHQVTGQSIDDYLNEHIFRPLGMTETSYNVTPENQSRTMPVHLNNEEGVLIKSPVQARMEGNTFFGGTYGLFSSMNDYLRFCQMMLNEGVLDGQRILSAETIGLMTQNQVGQLLGPSRGFGLGFGILVDTEKDPSPANSGQFYWGGYFKTHFYIDPKEGLIALLMTQKFPNTNEYVIALNRYVYGALEDK